MNLKQLQQKFLDYYKAHRQRTLIGISLLMTSLLFLWIFEKPAEVKETGEPSEMGVTIPKGYLVVPLELANAKSLSMMISRLGVVDVFTSSSVLVAKNLRVIKLNSEEIPTFGALVPEGRASELQGLFSTKNLRAALGKLTSEPTKFFSFKTARGKIETFNVQE